MIKKFRRPVLPAQYWSWLLIAVVLVAAAFFGQRASTTWLGVLIAAAGGLLLLQTPVLGALVLVIAALLVPVPIQTGTEVSLNAAALLVPALVAIWLLDMVRRRHIQLATSRTTLPLLLFLLAGLFSLFFGNVTWDPTVPRSANFLLVQLAQWAIFAFSAGAFLLAANLITEERWLWRLTTTFLLIAGTVAILRAVPGLGGVVGRFTTIAFIRAPLWVLLAGLAGGQLLFNRRLATAWRLFLLAVVGATLVYAFVDQQEAASNWIGLAAVLGTLFWLRWPRLRLPVLVFIALLAVLGVLVPTVYEFAGGDAEWRLSGASRLLLIERTIEVTMRNPITGLGPAAYRRYAAMEPLLYGRAFWVLPQVNSHNNYVDLFSHVGLLGLTLFAWFVAEVVWLGHRLRQRFVRGFAAGYVNGVLAVGAGALVVMLLADWILPFVYNIGFAGFQASVLVWLFLGGLVALDNLPGDEGENGREGEEERR